MKKPELRTAEMAEFVGIMLGDGSVGEYECSKGDGTTGVQRYVKMTISSEENQYREYLEELFESLFRLKLKTHFRKNESAVDLRCFRQKLFNFVKEEVGLKCSPKWERAEIPSRYLEKELERYVLRGYFDTDGSLVLTNNNGTLYPRLEMKISPSPMQEQFIEILERQGFRYGVYDIGKGKIRVQLNGKGQLEKWRSEIGFRNQRHIEKLDYLGPEKAK